jgi:hypothetical protein
MRLGRPVPGFVLSPFERTTLEQYARRPTTAQALALRALIVLRCATGATHTAVAADLDDSDRRQMAQAVRGDADRWTAR